MVAPRFVIRRTADRLEVELSGELDDQTLVACEAEVRARLSLIKPGGVEVLLDLSGVAGYTLQARDGLVALQRHLSSKARQTAYLTDCAASRGLALWVSHMVQGQVIKSFAERDRADDWLAGHAGPTTGVRPVARVRDGVRTSKKAG